MKRKCQERVKTSYFRLLNLHQSAQIIKLKEREEKVLKHSISISSVLFQICVMCDGKLTKIPERDFIFARVKTGQVGT